MTLSESTRYFITTGVSLIAVGFTSGDNRYLVVGFCMLTTPLISNLAGQVFDLGKHE